MIKIRTSIAFGIACLVILCCPLSKAADNVVPKTSLQINKYSFENGLTVLISPMPSSSAVSVYALVKTGSATEGKFLGSGISHFLEHMLFKGTQKRGVGQISKEIQALGGNINASTSFDYTIYTITVPYEKFDQALDTLADMLMNSVFDPAQIEKEREVVYGEMRLYKDRPENRLSEDVRKIVYTQHAYRIPIIGYEDLLRELKNEDFVEYYRARYIPDNTIVSIAGRVNPEEILPKVKKAFEPFKQGRPVLRNLTSEPQQVSLRRYEEEYKTDLTRVTLAFGGVNLLNRDMFAMDVLSMVLGDGESSRLYREIFKKQGLVQTISASNFTPMDRGVFEIDFIPRVEDVDAVIAAIKEQIRLIQEKGIEPAELEKIKRQIISSYLHGQQTSEDIAYSSAIDEFMAADENFSQKYVEAIQHLTSADVQRVAKQYLQDEHLSIVILKPKSEGTEASAPKEPAADSPIEKVVLDNGLTILLKENKLLPIVSVNLVLNGGVNQEPDKQNGLSELTARLWTDGTKSRSAEDIAQTMESRGASISGFSGRNSFGLKIGLLSEDLPLGLEILEDLVKNPAFDEKEFSKEKERVQTAIRAREDDISTVTSRTMRQMLFQVHPFRKEQLGTLESLEPITAKDVRVFYERLCAPKNMVLSVFGNFDKAQTLEILKKKFSDLKPKEVKLTMAEEPPVDHQREKVIQLDKEQAMVIIGFHGPSFYSKDRFGLEVLSSLLGSSFSGRLFNRIRDEFGQAYTLGGGYTPGRDMGFISFYVLTNKESVAKVKELLEEIIREIQEEPVGAQELAEMKSYMKGTFAMDMETNTQLSFTSALDELYGLGYNHYQSFAENIDQVTAEDIQRLAKSYLDLNKATLVVAEPGTPTP